LIKQLVCSHCGVGHVRSQQHGLEYPNLVCRVLSSKKNGSHIETASPIFHIKVTKRVCFC
jgi:DNA-directed RNA polymerase beta' subunit